MNARLAAAERENAALISVLDRTLYALRRAIAGESVRNLDEIISAAEAALASLPEPDSEEGA